MLVEAGAFPPLSRPGLFLFCLVEQLLVHGCCERVFEGLVDLLVRSPVGCSGG